MSIPKFSDKRAARRWWLRIERHGEQMARRRAGRKDWAARADSYALDFHRRRGVSGLRMARALLEAV